MKNQPTNETAAPVGVPPLATGSVGPAPITREIVRIGDGSPVGWSLYVEDYERAVKAMGDVIYDKVLTSGDAPANCAREALKAIGITPRNKTDQP